MHAMRACGACSICSPGTHKVQITGRRNFDEFQGTNKKQSDCHPLASRKGKENSTNAVATSVATSVRVTNRLAHCREIRLSSAATATEVRAGSARTENWASCDQASAVATARLALATLPSTVQSCGSSHVSSSSFTPSLQHRPGRTSSRPLLAQSPPTAWHKQSSHCQRCRKEKTDHKL